MNRSLIIPKDRIADFCRRYHIRRLAVFGSALRDDFGPDSDVDVLVDVVLVDVEVLVEVDVEVVEVDDVEVVEVDVDVVVDNWSASKYP